MSFSEPKQIRDTFLERSREFAALSDKMTNDRFLSHKHSISHQQQQEQPEKWPSTSSFHRAKQSLASTTPLSDSLSRVQQLWRPPPDDIRMRFSYIFSAYESAEATAASWEEHSNERAWFRENDKTKIWRQTRSFPCIYEFRNSWKKLSVCMMQAVKYFFARRLIIKITRRELWERGECKKLQSLSWTRECIFFSYEIFVSYV